MTKKEKYRILLKTGGCFLLLFLLCACIITTYDTLRNRKLGQEAFQQKKNYIYEKLVKSSEEDFQKIVNEVGDSAKSSLNGNFQNQYYSYLVYNDKQDLLAESKNYLNVKIEDGETTESKLIFPEELFSIEQKNVFITAIKENSRNKSKPPKYRFLCSTDSRDGQGFLTGLYVEKLEWVSGEQGEKAQQDPWLLTSRSWKSEYDGKNYCQSGSEIVMEWISPEISANSENEKYREIQKLGFPYYQDGFEEWNYWEQEEWLHNRKEISMNTASGQEMNWNNGKTLTSGFLTTQMETRMRFSLLNSRSYICLQIRASGRHLYTSLVNLKWAYLVMFFILGLCALYLSYGQIKTEEKRQQMEQDRKDFINGMTHELKTPLAIIRMCDDNLRIKELEYKKEYYLDMINQKTEEMDTMIRQMMTLSQINSIHFMLQLQRTNLAKLVMESLNRIAPLLLEKDIDLQMDIERVEKEVNQNYFEQLVSNLLSNAVSYVTPGGYIRIMLDEEELSIENAGEPISEDWKRDMFELFSSGKQLSGGREKHLGYGLYLVKKVAGLHGMRCEAENTSAGNLFRIRFKAEE
ncbi:sensor histidine kinase [Robinsoniella peoriensis]|uniref:sensor histidine kinase n=1 Tax=Robinsoniella peoriensis TaxID=180332 RepID=UPI003633AC74